jgi:hypothetical protein
MTYLRTLFLTATAVLAAPAQDVAVGTIGPFTIHKISVNGKFDRCAATLQPGPSMLRIAWDKDRNYHISTPSVPRGKGPLRIRLDLGSQGIATLPATDHGARISAKIDLPTVDKLMNVKKQIVADLDTGKFTWPIGNVDLTDVFVKIEDCVNAAQRR